MIFSVIKHYFRLFFHEFYVYCNKEKLIDLTPTRLYTILYSRHSQVLYRFQKLLLFCYYFNFLHYNRFQSSKSISVRKVVFLISVFEIFILLGYFKHFLYQDAIHIEVKKQKIKNFFFGNVHSCASEIIVTLSNTSVFGNWV